MARSINDARFTMWATVVPRMVTPGTGSAPDLNAITVTGSAGAYKLVQDADSGQIITVFDPNGTPSAEVGQESGPYHVRCYARAYTALGYRSSANRETYIGGEYAEMEAIQFDYPKSVILNHQSLIVNIRGSQDPNFEQFWLDGATGKPTVWEVQGASPVHDPFGKWLRNTTVLKRSEVQ